MRQWRASPGLTEAQFHRLVKLFGNAYTEIFDESLDSRQGGSSSESTFQTYEDLLFWGSYSIKSELTYDLLALGLSSSNVYQNRSVVIRVLETTLDRAGYMSQRAFQSQEAFKEYLANEPTILVDVTEQRIQRPGNKEDQKQDYSGKKKHTP